MLPEKSHKLRNILVAVLLLAAGYAVGYLTPVALTKKANHDAKSVASSFAEYIVNRDYSEAFELGAEGFKEVHTDIETLQKDTNLILGDGEITLLENTGTGDAESYVYLQSISGLPPAIINDEEITDAMLTVSVNKIDGKWQVTALSIDNNILRDNSAIDEVEEVQE